MGKLFGGSNDKQITHEGNQAAGISFQKSAYGVPISIVYGLVRTAPNIFWFGAFTPVAHEARTYSGGGGGKGGGGGAVTLTVNITYTYTVGIIYGLCEGPIQDAGDIVWLAKSQYGPPNGSESLGFSTFLGHYGDQDPWDFLVTNFPGQDIAYRGQAYLAASALDLGSSPSLPNITVQVQSLNAFGGPNAVPDVALDVAVNDLLTNTKYGAGFPSAKVGDWTQWHNFTSAAGIFLSIEMNEERAAADWIKEFCVMGIAEPVFAEGLLKIIPYGDASITGNGVTYTPDVTPQFDLTYDDLLSSTGQEPITIIRSDPTDAFNHVRVQFRNRDQDYNTSIAESKDDALIGQYGLRSAPVAQFSGVATAASAQAVAQYLLQRQAYTLNSYTFSVGWKYARLEPMDLVTIPDPTQLGSKVQVRIREISEDKDGNLKITAEEFILGVASVAAYPVQSGQGTIPNYNVSPGDVNTPVILDMPGVLTPTGFELAIAATGSDPNWGGYQLWMATEPGGPYRQTATIFGRARHGVVSAVFPVGADPDTVNTLKVDLSISKGVLSGGTTDDADNLNTLCWIEGEFVSFETATLTSQYHYDLKDYIRRGLFNTPVASHPINERFVRLDNTVYHQAYDPDLVGSRLYFKFVSFNIYGAGTQDISTVAEYSYLLPGAAGAPDDVTGFALSQNGNVVVFQWDLIDTPNVAGYEIRFIPRNSGLSWDNATALTQVTRGTSITTARVPPGDWTFLIRARDDSKKYSLGTVSADLTVTNVNTVLYNRDEAPDWIGTKIHFVRHVSGVLMPDDQHTAAYYGWEVFDLYVPTPYPICTYEATVLHTLGSAGKNDIVLRTKNVLPPRDVQLYDPTVPEIDPEIDLIINGTVRIHGTISAQLGPNETGLAQPSLEIDFATTSGPFGGFQDWTIGTALCRYVKEMVVEDTSLGVAYLSHFTPVVDAEERTERDEAVVVGGTGRSIVFDAEYHTPPNVQVTPVGSSSLIPTATSITTKGFTTHVYNSTTGVEAGGTINWTSEGV